MPGLYGWIVEQITAVENMVRAADKEHGRDWTANWDARTDSFRIVDGSGILVADGVQPGAAGLIALNSPAAVLRRCAADRKLLTVHKPRGVDWDTEDREWGGNPYVCEGCGQEGICQDWVTEHANDCSVLLAIAEGYGLTETELAVLDRPRWEPPRPDGPSVMGDVAAKLWGATLAASLRDGLVLHTTLEPEQPEPTPGEKAMRILEPELRAIPLYRPPEDPTP